jgi:hypothetical protein
MKALGIGGKAIITISGFEPRDNYYSLNINNIWDYASESVKKEFLYFWYGPLFSILR